MSKSSIGPFYHDYDRIEDYGDIYSLIKGDRIVGAIELKYPDESVTEGNVEPNVEQNEEQNEEQNVEQNVEHNVEPKNSEAVGGGTNKNVKKIQLNTKGAYHGGDKGSTYNPNLIISTGFGIIVLISTVIFGSVSK
jgi:hypothetical protein